jgi:ABC-type amino acid transport substrate-binding protein
LHLSPAVEAVKETMKRIAGSLFVLAAMLAAAPVLAETLSKIRETQTIVLAYRGSPPFSYLNENKKVTGYSIELCLKIVEAIKRELKMPQLAVAFLPVDLSSRFSAIIDGRADMECSSTTNTEERRAKVTFAIPHFFASVRMLVRSGSGIRSWPDLRDRKVVITKGTTTINLLNERSNARALNVGIVEGSDDMASFAMVEQGKADAFPMDDALLYGLKALSRDPDLFAVVGDPLSVEPYAIMLRKDDPAFKKLVDKEIARIMESREIYSIYNYWFMNRSGPGGANMNMPMGNLLRESLKYPGDRF